MTALAVFACVAAGCASGLVGWRWWLAHAMALAKLRKAEVDASVAALPGQLRELEARMTSVEWSSKQAKR